MLHGTIVFVENKGSSKPEIQLILHHNIQTLCLHFKKSDKNDEPFKAADGDCLTTFNNPTAIIRPERHAATRRAVAKSSMVFKVCYSLFVDRIELNFSSTEKA